MVTGPAWCSSTNVRNCSLPSRFLVRPDGLSVRTARTESPKPTDYCLLLNLRLLHNTPRVLDDTPRVLNDTPRVLYDNPRLLNDNPRLLINKRPLFASEKIIFYPPFLPSPLSNADVQRVRGTGGKVIVPHITLTFFCSIPPF